MALILTNGGTPLWSPSCCCSSSTSSKAITKLLRVELSVPRLHLKPVNPLSKPLDGLSSTAGIASARNAGLIPRAVADIDDPSPASVEPPSDSGDEESLSIDKLPLESKLQLKLEQKMKMKLAKKIRLRRKRLVRKRRLRKKGRWPPSKMNKLKNV
ncbi:unnamed protein product [Linum tenue]|uniref:50S ribosomal protein 5, chloroplastic n=1 Tax=Linum tenue TaxID=586396 RepID=A0AAV0M785_9ROSI|nr:unnamed protein product [Linum tenue]